MDSATNSLTRPSAIKVCVEVDLLAKLPSSIVVGIGNRVAEYPIEYEELPLYCSHCRIIGHNQGNCNFLNPELRKKQQAFTQNVDNRAKKVGTSTTTENRSSPPKVLHTHTPSGALDSQKDTNGFTGLSGSQKLLESVPSSSKLADSQKALESVPSSSGLSVSQKALGYWKQQRKTAENRLISAPPFGSKHRKAGTFYSLDDISKPLSTTYWRQKTPQETNTKTSEPTVSITNAFQSLENLSEEEDEEEKEEDEEDKEEKREEDNEKEGTENEEPNVSMDLNNEVAEKDEIPQTEENIQEETVHNFNMNTQDEVFSLEINGNTATTEDREQIISTEGDPNSVDLRNQPLTNQQMDMEESNAGITTKPRKDTISAEEESIPKGDTDQAQLDTEISPAQVSSLNSSDNNMSKIEKKTKNINQGDSKLTTARSLRSTQKAKKSVF